MAPKAPEKLQQQQQQTPLHSSPIVVKHSNPFHISAHTLCRNRRLKLKRSRYSEYIKKALLARPTSQQLLKTETVRRKKLSLLQADITIDLSSDEDMVNGQDNSKEQSVIVQPGRMCLERAALLGLMPVERPVQKSTPPPLISLNNNHKIPQISQTQQISIQQHNQHQLIQQQQQLNNQRQLNQKRQQQEHNQRQLNQQQEHNQRQLNQQRQEQHNQLLQQKQQQSQIQNQPRKRKSRPQKRRSLPPMPSIPPQLTILLNNESIVLSDDDDDEPEIVITCPTSHQIPCLPPQNTMQVDEEVTISLVPRSLTATSCASRPSTLSVSAPAPAAPQIPATKTTTPPKPHVFSMVPDETTVHTVIANRIYELSLTKLREGLASCGIPEFADGQQKISPQRRKGAIQKPPVVSPPQAPISLKLSSDLSISLISDDEDESRQRHKRFEPLLSPAFLQKLPVNVSIAPVPMRPPTQNHTTEPRKLKLG